MEARTRLKTHFIVACLLKLYPYMHVLSTGASFDLQSSDDLLLETCSNYFGCGSGDYYTGFKLCCVACNCNSTCVDTHSCCPKSEYASTITKPYRSDDKRLVCRNTVLRGQERSIYDHPEYEFIETCSDRSDETTRLYCEDIAFTNRSGVVAANTPVLDTISSFSYRNIYCASCNKIDRPIIEVWRPKLECKSNFDLRAESFGQVNGLERLIEYNNCLVSFEPPASSRSVKQCFNGVISACNVTGRWLTYNETDFIQCQILDMIYVSIEDIRRKYKNFFCARCNGETVYSFSDSKCPLVSNRFTITLTTILGFTIDELNSPGLSEIDQRNCPAYSKYDPLTDECRPIYCSLPFNVDAVASTCRLFHQFIENGKFVHSYKLVFQQLTPIRNAQAIVEIIYARIREADDIDNCGIGVFYQSETKESDITYLISSSSSNFNISGIYINVYSYVESANPKDLFELYDHIIREYLGFEEFAFFGPEAFDPVMLKFYDVETLNWIRLEYEENFTSNYDDSRSHYLFPNIYDGTIIVSHERNADYDNCKASIYEEDFLDCVSFLYKTTSRFSRLPHGLLTNFEGRDLVFNFTEFKTVNRTTVRICTDSVIAKTSVRSVASYLHLKPFRLLFFFHILLIYLSCE